MLSMATMSAVSAMHKNMHERTGGKDQEGQGHGNMLAMPNEQISANNDGESQYGEALS